MGLARLALVLCLGLWAMEQGRPGGRTRGALGQEINKIRDTERKTPRSALGFTSFFYFVHSPLHSEPHGHDLHGVR